MNESRNNIRKRRETGDIERENFASNVSYFGVRSRSIVRSNSTFFSAKITRNTSAKITKITPNTIAKITRNLNGNESRSNLRKRREFAVIECEQFCVNERRNNKR